MRKIVFRGKAVHNNQWVYGYYVERLRYENAMIYDPNGLGHDVYKETIGEYAGVKDTKEKEIFEGDICKGSGFYDEKATQTGVVKFDNGRFRIENINKIKIRGGEINLRYDISVIGNIYDNPEILEGGEE